MTVVTSGDPQPGEYGYTTRLVFRDDETGRQVIWWASSALHYEIGEQLTVTATVKAHDVFRETEQTVVSRANITTTEAAEGAV